MPAGDGHACFEKKNRHAILQPLSCIADLIGDLLCLIAIVTIKAEKS